MYTKRLMVPLWIKHSFVYLKLRLQSLQDPSHFFLYFVILVILMKTHYVKGGKNCLLDFKSFMNTQQLFLLLPSEIHNSKVVALLRKIQNDSVWKIWKSYSRCIIRFPTFLIFTKKVQFPGNKLLNSKMSGFILAFPG